MMTSPLSPFTTINVSVGTANTRAPKPTTAGMPNVRARMALCEVEPPRAVHKANT